MLRVITMISKVKVRACNPEHIVDGESKITCQLSKQPKARGTQSQNTLSKTKPNNHKMPHEVKKQRKKEA